MKNTGGSLQIILMGGEKITKRRRENLVSFGENTWSDDKKYQQTMMKHTGNQLEK